jgi:predicted lipoprotein with Yx(FWY)xxD motif
VSGRYSLVKVVSATLGAIVVCGCTQTTGGVAAPGGVAAATAGQPPPATVPLNAAKVEGLGAVLTDQDGMTLYRFDEDSADPPTSSCDADCVATWPPVLADGEIIVAGLDRELVGTMVRVDGDRQVTIGGWPLYRFAGDREPGDALGHGRSGTWHAATPEGGKAGSGQVGLTARDLPGFGPALTDRDGFTLYLSTNDTPAPSTSTCAGACVRAWPPVLLTSSAPALTGVDPATVGETTRDDGTRQLTVGGWPVYRHAEDTAPSQTNGHGVDDTFFVIEPTGRKSPAPSASRSPNLATGR